MTFRDVAGHVDAAEEERNAEGTGPLEGGEAVACLLETRSEELAHLVDIVTVLAGRPPKAMVRHQKRAGCIIGQASEQ